MTSKNAGRNAVDEFDDKLAGQNLRGIWQRREGPPKLKPRVWKWADIRAALEEAGQVVDLGAAAARRGISLVSPELSQMTTKTIFMDFQLVKPGELAWAHRHTAAAIRFIVESKGGYTTVDGEQFVLQPGDLVLTPNWGWHDHTNTTDSPVIWIDILDVGIVQYLDSMFGEPFGEGSEMQPIIKPDGYSQQRFGAIRPVVTTAENPSGVVPYNYTWTETKKALDRMKASGESDPYEGIYLEYKHPVTGGPTFPTMTCHIQLLPPGTTTAMHRHTGNTVYYSHEGSGALQTDTETLDWDERDSFVVPPWTWHRHINRSKDKDAILFSMTDRPILESLGLYRTETE